MQKVITINLNGNAFQLDEHGYDALRVYLEHAEAQLGGNPDASEIIRDLEQSVSHRDGHVKPARAAQESRVLR